MKYVFLPWSLNDVIVTLFKLKVNIWFKFEALLVHNLSIVSFDNIFLNSFYYDTIKQHGHQCKQATVLNCHRYLINTAVEKMNKI